MVKKPADYVLVNDNQQVECKTDSSNPAVQIQWFKYSSTTWTLLDPQPATSQTSAAYHGFMATSTLSVTAAKTMNQARYRCQTGNLYNDTTITVYFPPESMTLTEIPNGPVVQGTSKTLTCTTDSSNPVSVIVWACSSGATTWIHISPNPAVNHKPGSHSGQISTSSLVVPTDKNKNGRQYRCTAYQSSQPVNGVTNSTTLSISFQATTLTMAKKPADHVSVNDIQQIECKTDSSNPAVQIQWFTYSSTTWTLLDSQPATSQTSSANHGFVATSTLSITATKTMNQARYKCQTGNLYNDTAITVHFPPKSMTPTEIPNGPVVQGTSKTLTSTTDPRNPVSSIVWTNSSGAMICFVFICVSVSVYLFSGIY
ncbi:nephrin-like isoform X2 [Tubulanus polymorphus]